MTILEIEANGMQDCWREWIFGDERVLDGRGLGIR